MDHTDKRIEIHLVDEGTFVEGIVTHFTNWRLYVKKAWRKALRFQCPCGTVVDTSEMRPGSLFGVERGYLVQCGNCRRWYRHNYDFGSVEGVQTENSDFNSLFQRMPDEYGFVRGILAAPENVVLRDEYASFLSERGDSRAEALRLQSEIANTAENDPRHQELRGRLERLRPEIDPQWYGLVIRMGSSALSLIGCPDCDLAELPRRLLPSMINVRPVGEMRSGDYVVFCISSTHGPTLSTQHAIDRCRGCAFVPIAIVLTEADLVADDSLCSLVTVEGQNLLSRVLPPETVDRLPVFYDFDPWLAEKLLTCISDEPQLLTP